MKKALFFLLLLIIKVLQAQTTFQVTIDLGFNEYACDIKQTPDGGYIVSGLEFIASSNTLEIFLLKLYADGTVQWNRSYGGGVANGANYYQNYRVMVTYEGDYVVVGATRLPGSSSTDILVMKCNPLGDTIWSRTYGGPANDDGNSIYEDSNGDYIVGGSVLLNSQRRMAVLRIGTDGTLKRQSFLADGVASPFFECAALGTNRIGLIRTYSNLLNVVDSTGAYQWSWPLQYPSAWSVDAVDEANGQFSVFSGVNGLIGGSYALTRADQSGVISLAKKYSTSSDESPRDMIKASNGDYLIYGLSTATSGASAPLLARLDQNGAVLWAYNYRYAANAFHEAGKMIPTADGGYALLGQHDRSGNFTDFDVYVIKTDSNGQSGCNQAAATLNVASGTPVSTSPPTQFTGTFTNNGTLVSPPNGTLPVSNPNPPSILCLTTDIQNPTSENSVAVFPIPFQGAFKVSAADQMQYRMKVCDMLGNIILDSPFKGESEIQSTSWSSGVYFLDLQGADGSVVRRRLLKTE
ncbi:MAG: T9SS type A sorting domain-containing protein [Bacteroidota bacterium]